MSPGPRLIVVCGLPGSGKTTYAARLIAQHGGFRLAADDWMDVLHVNLWDSDFRDRIERLQWELAQELLRRDQTVIIEWGTWGRSERDELREGARALGAAVELHYLHEPIDVLWDRIRKRKLEDPPMTREQLESYADTLEVPTDDELALYDHRTTPL